MRIAILAIAVLLCALGAHASPLLRHEIEEIAEAPQSLHRRQGSFTPVTGIQEFGVQPRLEIRQLEANTDQWNLYLLGLARFQAVNQTDKLSWYQIAGQHPATQSERYPLMYFRYPRQTLYPVG